MILIKLERDDGSVWELEWDTFLHRIVFEVGGPSDEERLQVADCMAELVEMIVPPRGT